MLEKLMDEYFDRFGDNYPLCRVGHKSEKQIIAEIRRALETGEPVGEPEYEDGVDY